MTDMNESVGSVSLYRVIHMYTLMYIPIIRPRIKESGIASDMLIIITYGYVESILVYIVSFYYYVKQIPPNIPLANTEDITSDMESRTIITTKREYGGAFFLNKVAKTYCDQIPHRGEYCQ